MAEIAVRIAVAGLGRVFERFHLPALLATPDAHVVAVCDPDDARRAWASGRLRGVRVTRELDQLLGAGADALLLLTPPASHAELACAALRAGLHVLVEKPMAIDRAGGVAMADAARAANRRLQIGFTRRFREPYRRLKARLPSLDAGAAVAFDLRFPTSSWGAGAFLGDDRAGGGVLDDVLPHQADLLRWLVGASPSRARASADGAAGYVCELEFDSGMIARCAAGHGSYREFLAVRLAGKALAASGSTFREGAAAASSWWPPAAGLSDRAALAAARVLRTRNVTHRSFEAQLRDFLTAIRGGAASGAGPADGLAAIAVAEACRRSLGSGGWETVR
jgi:predicted dehydrogenase